MQEHENKKRLKQRRDEQVKLNVTQPNATRTDVYTQLFQECVLIQAILDHSHTGNTATVINYSLYPVQNNYKVHGIDNQFTNQAK